MGAEKARRGGGRREMKITEGDVKQFLEEGEFSSTTKNYYSYMMGRFIRDKGGELSEDSVREFKDGYKVKRSGNTALRVLRSFAGWKRNKIPPIGEDRMMQRFEMDKILGIKGDKVVMRLERKELSDAELKAIFGSLEGVKFSGIWCLAWFGDRPGELVELGLNDINKKPDTYLPPTLAKELRVGEHCVKFLTEKTKVERALFMDDFTKGHLTNFIKSGFGYPFLYRTCKDLREKVGVEFSPKWFRSTFQTKMQRILMGAGVPMVRIDNLVKVMSGHTITGQDRVQSIYTDFGPDIKRAMTEFHYLKPLEQEFADK